MQKVKIIKRADVQPRKCGCIGCRPQKAKTTDAASTIRAGWLAEISSSRAMRMAQDRAVFFAA